MAVFKDGKLQEFRFQVDHRQAGAVPRYEECRDLKMLVDDKPFPLEFVYHHEPIRMDTQETARADDRRPGCPEQQDLGILPFTVSGAVPPIAINAPAMSYLGLCALVLTLVIAATRSQRKGLARDLS